MKDDCMPGSTFDTRPLYTLPTTPRCRSRSTNTSATRSSSRMATIVSWPLEETIISFCITNPCSSKSLVPCRKSRLETWNLEPGTALVRESAHAYVQHQPEARERRDHRRPPVAHERKRQPFYGRQPCRHGDVVDHLEGEAGEHAEHEVRPQAIFRQAGRLERAQNHEQIQAERHQDAGKPLLLGQHREDEIVVGHGQKPELPLRALHETFAGEAPRTDGDARLDLLVAGAFRILRRIEERRDS